MVHCPNCETPLTESSSLEFTEQESKLGFIRASKRFYTASCSECGQTIGSGVAGAKANSGGA